MFLLLLLLLLLLVLSSSSLVVVVIVVVVVVVVVAVLVIMLLSFCRRYRSSSHQTVSTVTSHFLTTRLLFRNNAYVSMTLYDAKLPQSAEYCRRTDWDVLAPKNRNAWVSINIARFALVFRLPFFSFFFKTEIDEENKKKRMVFFRISQAVRNAEIGL